MVMLVFSSESSLVSVSDQMGKPWPVSIRMRCDPRPMR